MATLSARNPRQRAAERKDRPPSAVTEAPSRPDSRSGAAFIEPERRRAMICEAAYFLAERRGFCPGGELDDWLAAEGEIDRALASTETSVGEQTV